MQLAVPGHLRTQRSIQQHMGPLARGGEWERGRMMIGSGGGATISPHAGDIRLSAGGVGVGFGTHTGTQDSRVLEKVPCHFLLSEGEKVKEGSIKGSTKLVRQAGLWGRGMPRA